MKGIKEVEGMSKQVYRLYCLMCVHGRAVMTGLLCVLSNV